MSLKRSFPQEYEMSPALKRFKKIKESSDKLTFNTPETQEIKQKKPKINEFDAFLNKKAQSQPPKKIVPPSKQVRTHSLREAPLPIEPIDYRSIVKVLSRETSIARIQRRKQKVAEFARNISKSIKLQLLCKKAKNKKPSRLELVAQLMRS